MNFKINEKILDMALGRKSEIPLVESRKILKKYIEVKN